MIENPCPPVRDRKRNVSNLLLPNVLFDRKNAGLFLAELFDSARWTNFLPPVSKICLALAGLALVVGCAAPADRTKQLLELDLAHRKGAIDTLQKQQKVHSEPWQAYSLGVLYGADGDYKKMNQWFERCRAQTNTLDQDIEFIRLGHWRDEALYGDQAFVAGQWLMAVTRLENAILAAPEKSETRLRLVEARVMAFGPGLEEIRTLADAERPEAIRRWLEQSATPELSQQRLEVRVRLSSQLSGVKNENGDALAFYVAGELCRRGGDWLAMDSNYHQAQTLDPANREQSHQIQEIRNSVSGVLLKESLVHWADDQVPAALAKLDTADVVAPGRADTFQARRNIIALNGALTSSRVAETLAVGDLDQRWLTFWMSRLYVQNRLRDASMVADELLRHPQSLTPTQKSQALRVRVAFSRSIGHLNQARDDLREILLLGDILPTEAVILGDVLLAQSSYEEARHWFDKAQSWGDDSVSLILKKARIAFSQDRFTEMENLALAAVEQEPDNAEAQKILLRAQALSDEAEVRQ